jgi:hypothetical protein
MADSFYPLDSYRSVQVNTPTQVQDVEVVTVATVPTGVQFTYAVPLSVWKADSGVPTLGLMASYIEGLVSGHHVTGGTPAQDFDPNNLLTDYVDLIVEYDRSAIGLAPLQGVASVPIASVVIYSAGAAAQGFGGGVPDPQGIVDAEYARLSALAAA